MYNCLSGSGAGRKSVKSRLVVYYESRWFLQNYIYIFFPPFLEHPMAHGTENTTKSAHYPVMYLCGHRLCLTRLQVVSKIVDLKNNTRTLPKRPNQFRYWYPPEDSTTGCEMGCHPDLMHTSHEARQMDSYWWSKVMGPGLEYWSS